MTPEDVRERVRAIAAIAVNDDETAHIDEDRLRGDVLEHIAQTSSDPLAREMATEALKTSAIDFTHWYA